MNFDYTEQQIEIRNRTKDFSKRVLKPNAAALDQENRFPVEYIPQLSELGLMGIAIQSVTEELGMTQFQKRLR